jgi:hypothetical protein
VPVVLELKVPEEFAGLFKAETLTVAPGATTAAFKITCDPGAKWEGGASVTIRGTAMQDGKYAVVSEATLTVEPPPK